MDNGFLHSRPRLKISNYSTHSIAGYNRLVADCIEDIVDCCMLAAGHTEGNHRLHTLGLGIHLGCIDFDIPQPGRNLLHTAGSSARAERTVLRVGMNLRRGERNLPVAVVDY